MSLLGEYDSENIEYLLSDCSEEFEEATVREAENAEEGSNDFGGDADIRQGIAEHVQMYPVLYNLQHPKYYDRMVKLNAWQEISTKVGLGVCELRKKWRSMKAMHAKSKLGRPSGSGAYMDSGYLKAMSFLNRTSKPRKTTTMINANMRPMSAPQTQSIYSALPPREQATSNPLSMIMGISTPGVLLNKRQRIDRDDSPVASTPSPTLGSEETRSETPHTTRQRKKQAESPFEVAVVNALQQQNAHRAAAGTYNENEHFLLSLRGMLDRMTPETCSRVKLQIMKICVENEKN